MAQKSAPTEALIRRAEAARRQLSAEYAAIRHRLDVPARVKDSLRNNPLGWVGGSLAAGLAASTLLSPEQKQQIYEGNARRVYPRLDQALRARGR